jgi:hypothetical protein
MSHSPRPGERYQMTLEEVVLAIVQANDISFQGQNMPAPRRGHFVGMQAGEFVFEIVGYGPRGVQISADE